MTTCRICGMLYDPSDADDKKYHAAEHKKLASGIQPRKVRDDFLRLSAGLSLITTAVLSGSRMKIQNLEKLVVVYSWWNRALQNGVPQKDFDVYMNAHLAFADSWLAAKEKLRLALVSRNGEDSTGNF